MLLYEYNFGRLLYVYITSFFNLLWIYLFESRHAIIRSNPPEVILGVLKIGIKFTGEHSYRSVISIKLLCNFIEITLRHGCSPVNLLYIFRTPLPKKTSGGLLLDYIVWIIMVTGVNSIIKTLTECQIFAKNWIFFISVSTFFPK